MKKSKFTKIIQLLFKRNNSLESPSPNPTELYLTLRGRVFDLANQTKLTPNEFGLFALVKEYVLNEVVVTEVYVCDGSASLYFSNGGGRIGAGNHESVKDATKRLFEVIGESYKQFATHSSPPPFTKQDITVFYFVSESGIHAAASLTSDLHYEDHLLHNIFHASELVKTEMRSLESKN